MRPIENRKLESFADHAPLMSAKTVRSQTGTQWRVGMAGGRHRSTTSL